MPRLSHTSVEFFVGQRTRTSCTCHVTNFEVGLSVCMHIRSNTVFFLLLLTLLFNTSLCVTSSFFCLLVNVMLLLLMMHDICAFVYIRISHILLTHSRKHSLPAHSMVLENIHTHTCTYKRAEERRDEARHTHTYTRTTHISLRLRRHPIILVGLVFD